MRAPYRNERMEALRVDYSVINVLVEQYEASTAELCGFVFAPRGVELVGTHLALVRNVATDPHVEYEMDAGDTILAEQWCEDNDMLNIATFHTHPTAAARPSDVDARHGFGAWQIIVGREDGETVVRGYLGDFSAEVPVDLLASCGNCAVCRRHMQFAQPMRVNSGYICTGCAS